MLLQFVFTRVTKKAFVLSSIAALTLAQPMAGFAQDQNIPKNALIQMVRDNASFLCKTPTFTQCMGFSQQRCDELTDVAIDTCLRPLPDSINPAELKNESLEDCPQKVYADAGFSEDKAKMCFDEAVQAASDSEPKPDKPAGNQ
jgi:hypothetical protein